MISIFRTLAQLVALLWDEVSALRENFEEEQRKRLALQILVQSNIRNAVQTVSSTTNGMSAIVSSNVAMDKWKLQLSHVFGNIKMMGIQHLDYQSIKLSSAWTHVLSILKVNRIKNYGSILYGQYLLLPMPCNHRRQFNSHMHYVRSILNKSYVKLSIPSAYKHTLSSYKWT